LESMLKSSPSLDSMALFSLTGIFTKPKLIAPDQIALMINSF